MVYDRIKYTLPLGDMHFTSSDFKVYDDDIHRQVDYSLIEKLPDWLRNVKTNLDTIGFENIISTLPNVDGPAIVIDHSFTGSLENHLDLLKGFKGTIFACDRALYKLIPYRIPEYVANLDSSYLCMSFFDRPDVRKIMDKVTAVFATTTFPLTIRHWTGRRVFFTPWVGNDISASVSAITKTPVMQTGGNVATFLWLLATVLKANPIGLIGIDNGFKKMEQTEYPGVPHKKFEGPYGVYFADPVYEWYAKWHLSAIRFVKREKSIETVNCNKSGIMYSEDITDMSLEEFMEKYNK